SKNINNAVSGEGRISKHFVPESHADELGDMERQFASVMQRLHEYNRYLEAMAARLAHEFRTPLSIVESSLDNLTQDDNPLARTRYLSRAAEGTKRLSLILTRMREATRLEQILEITEQETVNLSALISLMIENYRSSYPDTQFECRLPELPLTITGAPELIVQALDKLINNAVDFHTIGTPVLITLNLVTTDECRIAVINQGPKLPAAMQQQLFDSMVSIRDKSDSNPHLGLGLYLVRLITEFHHGSVAAENTDGGVCVSMNLPLNQQQQS
ncbi:MAG: ATP-binding protein, partial [Pseudomonadota bacterium]